LDPTGMASNEVLSPNELFGTATGTRNKPQRTYSHKGKNSRAAVTLPALKPSRNSPIPGNTGVRLRRFCIGYANSSELRPALPVPIEELAVHTQAAEEEVGVDGDGVNYDDVDEIDPRSQAGSGEEISFSVVSDNDQSMCPPLMFDSYGGRRKYEVELTQFMLQSLHHPLHPDNRRSHLTRKDPRTQRWKMMMMTNSFFSLSDLWVASQNTTDAQGTERGASADAHSSSSPRHTPPGTSTKSSTPRLKKHPRSTGTNQVMASQVAKQSQTVRTS
jgi:hypothetical protein